jgi:hypothetical protein
MGNFCARSTWNDQQVMQSWLPSLAGIFTYDGNGTITGLDESHTLVTTNSTIVGDQLKSLPLLLKGKAGVGKSTLNNIKALQSSKAKAQAPQSTNPATNPSTQQPEMIAITEPPQIVHRNWFGKHQV